MKSSPAAVEAWDELEDLAATHQLPDEVADAYREVLAGDLAMDLVNSLGQRAVRFHEEWFGDDPSGLEKVLGRVLDLQPASDWALQRLSLVLTSSERWTDLLAAYDRAVASSTDKGRKISLLDEAAHLAKDFAGQSERAIGYLQQLVEEKPGDPSLLSSLERLLELHERWADLIALWESQLPAMERADALDARVRIAECSLERMGDSEGALHAVEHLLGELGDGDDDSKACSVLERILVHDATAPSVRQGALDRLRERYESGGRTEDFVRVLDMALGAAGPVEGVELHREAAELLVDKEADAEALEHYAALLKIDPAEESARIRFRELADRSSNLPRYADGLVAAADEATDPMQAAALILEAADVHEAQLGDPPRAAALYARVLSQTGVESHSLEAARRLSALLEKWDRPAERLDVLERRATLETDAPNRAAVLAEVAQLAARLEQNERALAAWNARMAEDPSDLVALDATAQLLERTEQWSALVEVLRRRLDAPVSEPQRRADLIRIAHVQAERLSDADSAIATWQAVGSRFGNDDETVDALFALLSAAGRWQDVADLLEPVAGSESGRAVELFSRLGGVYREHLGAPDKAADLLGAALRIDPGHESAKEGLKGLLEDESVRNRAAEALGIAFAATDDWRGSLDLLEYRVAGATEASKQVALLREAARLNEERADDAAAALSCYRRAFSLAPRDRQLEEDVVRLAGVTDEWPAALESVRAALPQVADDPIRLGALRRREAFIAEHHLGDSVAASDALQAALALQRDDLDLARSVLAHAAGLARWEVAARTLVDAAVLHGRIDDSMLATLSRAAAEQAAGDAAIWDTVAGALGTALAGAEGLTPPAARTLELCLADWHVERRNDTAAGESALARAAGHGLPDVAILRRLAAVQRAEPGRPLLDTLMRIADESEGNLDPLYEAAELCLGPLKDIEAAVPILERLLEDSSRLWRRGTDALGERSPEACATSALERLMELARGAEDHHRVADLLMQGTRLPFATDRVQAMRREAAGIFADQLGDRPRAIETFRDLLQADPRDAATLRRLGDMYEQEGRLAELLELRKRELALVLDVDKEQERRLELRLDVVRLAGEVEARANRLEALRQNLSEKPAHQPSIDAAWEMLSAIGKHEVLADLVADQASRLDADPPRAARLWARVARLAEDNLHDTERAIVGWRRVAANDPSDEALQALSRLHTERGEPLAAAEWLERRMNRAEGEERTAIASGLVDALLAGGKRKKAASVLEIILEEQPEAQEIRMQRIDLLRQSETWEELAEALVESADHMTDDDAKLGNLREAAHLFRNRLGAPDRAIEALQRAMVLAGDDRELKSSLAEGLRAAGRFAEAREVLEAVIADFGRRRPKDRADVHFELAKLCRAEGDLDGAFAQLELASKIAMQNPAILSALGEVALDAGQLERAEKSYRSLLLVVRRQRPDDPKVVVGSSEVLFQLHRIAEKRGEEVQARELVESAFEAAKQSDAEAARLQRSLRKHAATDLLLRVIDMRLGAVTDSRIRSGILSDLAEVQEDPLGKTDEALQTRLKALKEDPASAAIHDATLAMVRRLDEVAAYVNHLEEMVAKMRRKDDAPVAADLCLRLGAVYQTDLDDLEKAAAALGRIDATENRVVEGWVALAAVVRAQGNADEERRLLQQVSGAADVPPSFAADALYRLAELSLAEPEERAAGSELLMRALEAEPRWGEAGEMLQKAASAGADQALLDLYERVARKSGEAEMLLDALERRAALDDVSLELVRESAELAMGMELRERAEPLLQRAIKLAEDLPNGLGDAIWAPLALAELRKGAEDWQGAVEWLREAADACDVERATPLLFQVATLASGEANNLELAAETYEQLLEQDSTDRAVWEPLVQVYRRLGDHDRLEGLVSNTLQYLAEAGDRNTLRMEHAGYLLEVDRPADAVVVLKDVLMEDAGHREASRLLEEYYAQTGQDDELIAQLEQQLDASRDRGDKEAIKELSLRIGEIYERTRPEEAKGAYRSGLEWVRHDKELLLALQKLLDEDEDQREWIEVQEGLLTHESGPDAAARALELAQSWENLGDDDGVQRSLEIGYRAAPGDDAVAGQLRRWYQEHDNWGALADMIAFGASVVEDADAAVEQYREAARIHREELGNPGAAAVALRSAHDRKPEEISLLDELVTALGAAGQHHEAVEELGDALDSFQGADRVALLRRRAQMLVALGDEAGGVRDLEAAFQEDEGVGGQLAMVLRRWRSKAAEAGDAEAERDATFRLVGVLERDPEERDQARTLLDEWVHKSPEDREALYRMRDLDLAAQNWDALAHTCTHLLAVEEGEARVAAAVQMADAYEKAGQAELARPGLEQMAAAEPENAVVRERLHALYAAVGAHRELGEMLLQNAQTASDDHARFELYRQAGEHFVAGGDPGAAVDPLRMALQLRPDDHQANLAMIDTCVAAGNLAEAEQMLQAAIAKQDKRRSPELADLQQRMAHLARALGDVQTELEWLNAALASDRNNGSVAAELADRAMEVGDFDTALKGLRAVTMQKTVGPMSRAVAFLRQAQIALHKGDKRAAGLWAKKAFREDETLTEAVELLETIGGRS